MMPPAPQALELPFKVSIFMRSLVDFGRPSIRIRLFQMASTERFSHQQGRGFLTGDLNQSASADGRAF